MSTRALYESLSFIGSTWPKDALRLDVNFGQSVITAAERCLAAEALASPPPQTSSSQGVKTRIDTKSIQFRDLGKEEVKMTENAVNALQAIKEGRASTQYPMPASLTRPASNPEYYIRLGKMLESAARGEKMEVTWGQRLRIFFDMKAL